MPKAIITSTAASGHVNFRTPTLPSAICIGVGCSGSDPIWNNGGVSWVVGQVKGTAPRFDKCSTPGAPISYHITVKPAFGVFAWENMAPYEFLHIGDNPNLDGIHDPTTLHKWAQKFWAEGNGGQGGETLLWTLQPGYRPDPTVAYAWMTNAEMEYNRAQDYCNARRPDNKRIVRQIPGLQLFRRFYDDQQAGTAPTATWLADLYEDGFHIIYGKIALIAIYITASCMYNIDPFLLPADTATKSGFTAAEILYVKKCISDTIKGFNRAGVNTSGWQ